MNTLDDYEFLAACQHARVLPERVFFQARTEERNVARRMVCYRLLHAGWKPGRVAKALTVSVRQVRYWAERCPAKFNSQAWRQKASRPLLTALLNFRFR